MRKRSPSSLTGLVDAYVRLLVEREGSEAAVA
ncbi:MAG: hypothetical protein JWM53_4832, partial [bacterium]|nr:hypothetical protein [bacterium]